MRHQREAALDRTLVFGFLLGIALGAAILACALQLLAG